jgi:hypothetical protein
MGDGGGRVAVSPAFVFSSGIMTRASQDSLREGEELEGAEPA